MHSKGEAPVVPLGQPLFAGRYELLGMLARGGMGDVWRARHVGLDRIVAIKRLRPGEDEAPERLIDEARALAQLRHPAIVQVFDCGFDESGVPFMSMELLEGQSLAQHLSDTGALGAARAVSLLLPALSGLQAAHDAGIVHRDLKPENIVLSKTSAGLTPVLIDFGIAYRQRNQGARLTQTGSFVGTPQYMAPEQTLGARGDPRSDVWGLSVVLYEALSGAAPFLGQDMSEIFRKIAFEPPPFPAQVRDMDGRLWSILMRGLRKQPDDRHASCRELENDLRSWLAHAERKGLPAPFAEQTSTSPLERKSSVTAPTEQAGTTPLDTLIRQHQLKR